MKASWLGGVAIVGALAGCYSPSIEPCIYACNGQACPNGLTCNNDKMCALAKGDRCVAGDGAIADVSVDTSCGLPVTTNVDACALGLQNVNTNLSLVGAERVLVDTDMLTITSGSGGPIGGGLTLTDVPQTLAPLAVPHVALLKVARLSIPAGATFTVQGKRPLVILVNGVVAVDGLIDVLPVVDSTPCLPAQPAGMGIAATGNTGGAGGGGGGGYGINDSGSAGAAGGVGGTNTSAIPPNLGANSGVGGPASAPASERLSPLHPGCPGGDGGARGANGLQGGYGGGALQISASTSISVAGEIHAPGAGGLGVLNTNMTGVGAGGGGSGGAILLEAPQVLLANSKLCANGGGGGNGGTPAQSGLAGQPGSCSLVGALGGLPGANEGVGATATVDAVKGQMGVSATMVRGGSGGGGGVGRIRINGAVTMSGSALSTPAFSHP